MFPNILETPTMLDWKFSLYTENILESVPQEGSMQQKHIEVLDFIKAKYANLLSKRYRELFTRGKAAGVWRWSFISSQSRGQEWWSYTCTRPYVFMA
jgi:hypothetical protein